MTVRERRNLLLQVFILTAVILIAIYLYYPIINTIYLSLFEIKNFNLDQRVFIGLNNYTKLLKDPTFWLAFRNTVLIASATIFVQMPIAFLLADFLSNQIRKKRPHLEVWLLLALFFPIVLPTPVLAKSWRLFFVGLQGAGYGPFEWITLKLGLTNLITSFFKTKTVLLLQELNTALWVVIAIQTWARIGFNLLIYRSAILSITSEIYESAEMDGAGPWTKLFYITTPLTRNVISVTIILAILGVFQLFDMIWMLTNQCQPLNTTQVLATYMYTRSFVDLRTGYGSSIAITILVTAVVLSLIQRWFFRESK